MIVTSGLIVRPLEVYELPLCAPHGEGFFRDWPRHGTFDLETFLGNWMRLLTGGAMLWGAWKDDELIGGLGTVLQPDLYDGHLIAQECFLYVAPAHRKSTALLRLFTAYHAWADVQDAECRLEHLLNPDETGDPREVALAKLYTRLDYQPIAVAWSRPRLSERSR